MEDGSVAGIRMARVTDSTVQVERSKQAGDNQQDWSFTGRKEMFGKAGFQETGTCMNGCLHFMRCDWAASP